MAQHECAATAAVEAVQIALSGFAEARPSLAFVFASPRHELATVVAAIARLELGIDVVGCSTAGEITELGVAHGSVSVLLVHWGDGFHELLFTAALGTDAVSACKELYGDIADRFGAQDSRPVSVVIGNGLSPTLEKLITQLQKATRADHQLVGAGAADESALERTFVAAGKAVSNDGAAALHVFSRKRWGIGVAHGVKRVGALLHVTRARGNVVEELDGRRALDVYESHAESRGVVLQDTNRRKFMLENAVGVLLFDDVVRVRAPIGFETNGSIRFAGEVPEGSTVCFTLADPADLVRAAESAAEQASAGLQGVAAAAVLVFSSMCRGSVLGERCDAELQAVRSVFPDVPIAGFSSYAEIARTVAKLDGYHNGAIVVAAIPE